eukprot:CAMPEP_0204277374 /NCGR_PEP_ID=MMETSP0468-20130131/29262_1 /ASSEMBLY_ACC=CAM_ASM_000383 /TAXON_ID=2969 /ORGANISM="Oxyrrhis marina" /LENGTH=336 /DNA_ID=CAMNT_0051254139 /DNA_START=51 /DNA_END=1061 /DNA_ORIENTATION=-
MRTACLLAPVAAGFGPFGEALASLFGVPMPTKGAAGDLPTLGFGAERPLQAEVAAVVPRVNQFDASVMDAGNHVLIAVFDPQSPKVRGKEVRQVAGLFEVATWAATSHLNLTTTACVRCRALERIMRNFAIAQQDLPLSILIPRGITGGHHFRLPGTPHGPALIQFTEQFLAGELQPFIKSEEKAETYGPLRRITGKTFQAELIESPEDALVFIGYGWLPETRRFEEAIAALAETLAPVRDHLRVGLFDESLNAVPTDFAEAWWRSGREQVGTLVLFSAHDKSSPEFFDLNPWCTDGELDVRNFSQAVLRWAAPMVKHPFVIGVDGSVVSEFSEDL